MKKLTFKISWRIYLFMTAHDFNLPIKQMIRYKIMVMVNEDEKNRFRQFHTNAITIFRVREPIHSFYITIGDIVIIPLSN